MEKSGLAAVGRVATCRINGKRCVFQGERLVGNIYDHRKRCKTDACSGVAGDWAVASISSLYDWHDTYGYACNNALTGAGLTGQSVKTDQAPSELLHAGFKVVARCNRRHVADPVYLCDHWRVAGGRFPADSSQVVSHPSSIKNELLSVRCQGWLSPLHTGETSSSNARRGLRLSRAVSARSWFVSLKSPEIAMPSPPRRWEWSMPSHLQVPRVVQQTTP